MSSDFKTADFSFSDNTSVLHFPKGLYGFEEYTEFKLSESEYRPFMWLQAVHEKKLAFLVVDPFMFFPDYELDVDDESVKDIGVKDASDVLVITIVTLAKDKKTHITANLQGPLIINKNNKTGKQIVLQDPRWLTKHDLSSANSRSSSC
ncbi:flagellar assembly protein FliW [Treponema sp. OMZ 840]|uniref:flagellar assembly protein FliW n=1 Tax=Treponema sp. OMZ 840 TaxID=244313 RepID=UPI003D8E3D7B